MESIAQPPISVVHTARPYTRTAVVLHWALVMLLVTMTALGWYMASIEDDPGSAWYFDMHKSIGIVIAVLVAARLVWRLTHRPLGLPETVPRLQARLSQLTQTSLYLVMVFIPVTGYLGASYSKAGVQLFGLATPHWALPNHDAAERLFGIHSVLVWVLVIGVGIHVLGAIKHLVIDKDGVFQRMWFRS